MPTVLLENNSNYPLTTNGVTIAQGFSEIDESDWKLFEVDSLIKSYLSTGEIKILGTKQDLPKSLNSLSLKEAKAFIKSCTDNQLLKQWYLDLEPSNFKPRLLIVQHAMDKNLPLRFTDGELKSYHYADLFKSLTDSHQPIEQDLKTPAQIECERMTLKNQIWEKYQAELAKIQ